jgi:hypothetical protein
MNGFVCDTIHMFNGPIIMFALRIMSQCLEIYVITEFVDCYQYQLRSGVSSWM